jgi:hypothetical protein
MRRRPPPPRPPARTSSARSSRRTSHREAHDRRHPLPAGAERLPAHRPRQERSASTSASRRSTAARLQPPLRRHEPGEGGRRVRRRHPRRTSAGSASTGARTSLRLGLLRPALRLAEELIRQGKAYVCDLTADEIRATRGTLTDARQEQPLPGPQRRGEPRPLPPHARRGVPDGAHGCSGRRSTWRRPTSTCGTRPSTGSARRHHRTGDAWCIYPMYDYAHGSGLPSRGSPTPSAPSSSRTTARSTTGSSWTRFFQRPLPRQIEFARLNLTYTVMSKRKLLQLVQELGIVAGWDDPRMPTLAACAAGATRRRPSAPSPSGSASPSATGRRGGPAGDCIREDLEARAPAAWR